MTIDLAEADLAVFEAYEATVLPLAARYGGRLEMRVRALDGSSETHLLFFPDAQRFADYLADPDRVAVLGQWAKCRATAVAVEVERVGS